VNKAAAAVQMKSVATVNRSAARLPATAFERKEVLADYRKATASLDRAAQSLTKKADALSRQDFIIAEARLTVASKRAEQINARALAGAQISNAEVVQLTAMTAPTETYMARIAMGEPPVPRQTVTVRLVHPMNGDVQGQKVYVLPADYMDNPDLFPDEMFMVAIKEFSFGDETSPTSRDLPASEINLWVGPRMMDVEMAALAKQRKVTRYRPLNIVGAATSVELQFIAPDDIVRP